MKLNDLAVAVGNTDGKNKALAICVKLINGSMPTEDERSFDVWVAVHRVAPKGSRPQTIALQKMVALVDDEANQAKGLIPLYKKDDEGSPLRMIGFFNDSQLRKWREICTCCDRTAPGLKLKRLALQKMAELAETLSDCMAIYHCTSTDRQLPQLAIDKLGSLNGNLRQWLEAYEQARRNSRLKNIALAQLAKLAVPQEDSRWLLEAYDAARTGSQLEKILQPKLAQLELPFYDWLNAYNNSRAGSPLEKCALEKIASFVEDKDIATWRKVYENHRMDFEQKMAKLANRKMAGFVEQTFDQWREAHDNYGLGQFAVYMMAKTAQSTEQWAKVIYYNGQTDKNLNKNALNRMEELANTTQDWLAVLNASLANKKRQSKARTQISKLAKTFEDWLDVHMRTHDTILRRRAMNGMMKLARKLEQWSIIYDSTEKKELALRKMAKLDTANP